MKSNKIIVCATCSPPDETDTAVTQGLDDIANALDEAGLADHFSIETVDCMGACEEPSALALQGAGRATYLFCGLNPANDAADIAKTCATYLKAEAGWIEDARSCGRLRDCLRARVPAFDRS